MIYKQDTNQELESPILSKANFIRGSLREHTTGSQTTRTSLLSSLNSCQGSKEGRNSINTITSMEDRETSYTSPRKCVMNLSGYYNKEHCDYLLKQFPEVVNMNRTINYVLKEKLIAMSKKESCSSSPKEDTLPYCLRKEEDLISIKSATFISSDCQKRKGWICLNCKNFNFERRKQCNKCNQSKVIISLNQIQYRSIDKPNEEKPVTKKTDWKCARCLNLNYSFRNKCNCCNLPLEISNQYLLSQTACIYLKYAMMILSKPCSRQDRFFYKY